MATRLMLESDATGDAGQPVVLDLSADITGTLTLRVEHNHGDLLAGCVLSLDAVRTIAFYLGAVLDAVAYSQPDPPDEGQGAPVPE